MNVLFVICDDLNTMLPGFGRHPQAYAPNLERLMRRSTRLVNAHNNCPICLPSRSSMLSGLYPHTTGHFTLHDDRNHTTRLHIGFDQGWQDNPPLLASSVWLPQHFRAHGYRAYSAGKVDHFDSKDWWDEMPHGSEYGPYCGPAQISAVRQTLLEGEPLAGYIAKYEGVDRLALQDGRFRWPIEFEFNPLEVAFASQEGILGDGRHWHYQGDNARDPLPDERTAAYGVDVLRRKHNGPFMLALGFMKPHTPLNVPRRFFDLYPPEQLELPPVLAGDTEDCARALCEHRPYGFMRYQVVRQKGGERLWREWLQAYLACVTYVDEQVGKVLSALEASPYRDDTVVVFTSDNGYHVGEKEYLFKDTLWEEGGGVPLIIHDPRSPEERVCSRPVSLIDLYPTLLDLCDLPGKPHAATHGHPLDGHSLGPLLRDPAGPWPGPPVALMSVRGNSGIHHSVRSATHRYILCQNGEEELYDHRVDPFEWHNLASASDQAEIKAEMKRALLGLVYGVPHAN